MDERKVNLFIVGVAKCGTTSVYRMLISHPDIFGGPLKEPHYFARNYIPHISSKFQKMTALTYEAYQKNYQSVSNQKYLIDASVNYILYPEVADEIYQYNHKAKIIIILRNPVDRLYSHYKMIRKEGYTNLSFADFLQNPKDHLQINLLEQGKNAKQIKHYIKVFGKNNVLVITFKQICENQEQLRLYLADFLQIVPFINKEEIHENISKIPKNEYVQFFHNDFSLTKCLKRIVTKSKFRRSVGRFIMNRFYMNE